MLLNFNFWLYIFVYPFLILDYLEQTVFGGIYISVFLKGHSLLIILLFVLKWLSLARFLTFTYFFDVTFSIAFKYCSFYLLNLSQSHLLLCLLVSGAILFCFRFFQYLCTFLSFRVNYFKSTLKVFFSVN